MGIFSFVRDTFVSGFGSARRSQRTLRSHLEDCEALIIQAAERGVELAAADIEMVRTARRALTDGTLSRAVEANFYSAYTRIASRVGYPGVGVFEDIQDAMRLLSHAAQSGKLIAAVDVQAISAARQAQRDRTWSPAIEAAFYAATCRVSSMVSPVIAETVGSEARRGARRAIKIYTLASIVLTICVALMSCVMFVVVQASQDISDVVKENDESALSLHNELQAHAATIVEAEKSKGADAGMAIVALQNSQPALQIKQQLQQFVTNNRQLYADVTRIRKLYGLVGLSIPSPYKQKCPDKPDDPSHVQLYWPPSAFLGVYQEPAGGKSVYPVSTATRDHFDWQPKTVDWQCDPDQTRAVLEITLPLLGNRLHDVGDLSPIPSQEEVVEQGFQKIAVYQDIRAMAMYIHDIILSFVGAVTEFMLPILYASLGACAAILRQLSSDCMKSVFHPEHSKVQNRAHIVTAVIVGITIGLFNDLVDGGKKASPLAIAFVAGYASDKFFHYLDRLVDTLFPTRNPASRDGASPPVVNDPNRPAGEGP